MWRVFNGQRVMLWFACRARGSARAHVRQTELSMRGWDQTHTDWIWARRHCVNLCVWSVEELKETREGERNMQRLQRGLPLHQAQAPLQDLRRGTCVCCVHTHTGLMRCCVSWRVPVSVCRPSVGSVRRCRRAGTSVCVSHALKSCRELKGQQGAALSPRENSR